MGSSYIINKAIVFATSTPMYKWIINAIGSMVLVYVLTFGVYWWYMLPYILYMDPMGMLLNIHSTVWRLTFSHVFWFLLLSCHRNLNRHVDTVGSSKRWADPFPSWPNLGSSGRTGDVGSIGMGIPLDTPGSGWKKIWKKWSLAEKKGPPGL